MAILKPLTFKQTKLKEFRERLSEYCSWELEGTSTTDRLERREQFEQFLSSTIDEAELKAFNKGFRLAADKMEELNDKEKNVKLFKKIERQEIEIKLLRAKLGGVKE